MAAPGKTALDLLLERDVVIIDGGLATELEKKGCNLQSSLWSAAQLKSAPDKIEEVHRDFLEAGADVVITATYQASCQGIAESGIVDGSDAERRDAANDLISSGVRVAQRACAASVLATVSEAGTASDSETMARTDCVRPIVAASVGPYGAVLADGSEYAGDYDISDESLAEFHAARLEVLLAAEPDILAMETIPCLREVRILCELLRDRHPKAKAWISFSCKDAKSLHSGDQITDCARLIEEVAPNQVVAVGVNCTHPRYIPEIIQAIRSVTPADVRSSADGTRRRIIAYPNSGEAWDASTKSWVPGSAHPGMREDAFKELVASWIKAGATMVGGCCKTTPSMIRQLHVAHEELGKLAASIADEEVSAGVGAT